MKSASSALISFLAANKFCIRTELLTIMLQSGTILYYVSGQEDLTYNGNVYLAPNQGTNPGWQRSQVQTRVGVEVNSMDLTLLCSANTLLPGGVNPASFATGGGFDNATVSVDCMPMSSWGNTSLGTYNIWGGLVSDATVDRTQVKLTVDSTLRVLQGSFPRNYFQPTCNHTLYDTGCTLLKANFSVAGAVATGSWTTSQFNSNLTTQADDYFDLGWVVWNTGANTGLIRTTKTFQKSGGNFLLVAPLPHVPQGGDTFTAYPGCDKTQPTCTNKFNNLANFRGFPYMPVPTTLAAGQGTGPVTGVSGGGSPTQGGAGGQSGHFKQF